MATGKENTNLHNRKRRAKMKDFQHQYKEGCGCIYCGEKDFRVLTFHHRNPADKEFTIADGWCTIKQFIVEIEKCDVTCRNCHNIADAVLMLFEELPLNIKKQL